MAPLSFPRQTSLTLTGSGTYSMHVRVCLSAFAFCIYIRVGLCRYDNRTFLNKGEGPMSFLLKDMPKYVKTGDENWHRWFGMCES